MTILRNVLAIVIGLAVGSIVNMGLVILGSQVIPPPEGVDVTDAASINASMHLFEPKHFVTPFVAHALGTLVGALTAYLVAGSHRSIFAYAIGALSLAGGIAAASMIPAPTWFVILDLVAAYVPMAFVAIVLGRRLRGTAAAASA